MRTSIFILSHSKTQTQVLSFCWAARVKIYKLWSCFYNTKHNLRFIECSSNSFICFERDTLPWQCLVIHQQLFLHDWKFLQFSSFPAGKTKKWWSTDPQKSNLQYVQSSTSLTQSLLSFTLCDRLPKITTKKVTMQVNLWYL